MPLGFESCHAKPLYGTSIAGAQGDMLQGDSSSPEYGKFLLEISRIIHAVNTIHTFESEGLAIQIGDVICVDGCSGDFSRLPSLKMTEVVTTKSGRIYVCLY